MPGKPNFLLGPIPRRSGKGEIMGLNVAGENAIGNQATNNSIRRFHTMSGRGGLVG
jgi:hypothetical protein